MMAQFEDRSVDERLEELENDVARLTRSRWIGPVTRGGLPQSEVRDTLPPADELHGYQLVTLRGTPDVTYQCLRDSAGVWDWREIATGGA